MAMQRFTWMRGQQGIPQCLEGGLPRMEWVCYAYCLIINLDHLVIETLDGNLFRGMCQLNGSHTQHINTCVKNRERKSCR